MLNRIHLIELIIDICKLKIKLKPLHSNNCNICIGMFNETIISYLIPIEIARNFKYSIKKHDDIEDSNGVNMLELPIDFRLNDNGKRAVFSLGHRKFVAKSLALKEMHTSVSCLILKYEFYVACNHIKTIQESKRNTCECQKNNGILMDAKLSFDVKQCILISYNILIVYRINWTRC